MLGIVPPVKQLAASKGVMVGALKDPIRIKTAGKKVQLADARGHVRALSRLEQVVWETIVIPYFIKMSPGGDVSDRVSDSGLSNPEKKVMEKRQAEISAYEKELLEEREKLKVELEAQEMRSRELKKMQDQMENRMSRVEASQADLARLKKNLQRRIRESEAIEVDAAESALLKEKAAELKAKELALESAKQELAQEREQLDTKASQLEQMQRSLLRKQAPDEGSGKKEKSEDLEQRESELEERMRYVANVENDLIDRLNQLSEREASIEQTEVEAGIRED